MPENSIQKFRLGPAGPALLALAILASFFVVPLAGPFLVLVLPAPLAYARLRYGSVNFALASALCLVMTAFGGGFPVFSAMAAGLSLTAFVLAGSLAKGERYDLGILKGALLPLLAVGPLAGLYFLAAGVDPWALLAATLDQGVKESVDIYKHMGMSQADIDALMPSLKLFKTAVMDYFPAILLSISAWASLFSFILLRRRAAKDGLAAGSGLPMNRWLAPDHAVWGVIIPGFLLIPAVPVLRQAAGNLLVSFAVVYMFQGMAVVSFLFERFKVSPFLRWLGWLLILLQPLLGLLACSAGLFDTWLDFRKLRPRKPK